MLWLKSVLRFSDKPCLSKLHQRRDNEKSDFLRHANEWSSHLKLLFRVYNEKFFLKIDYSDGNIIKKTKKTKKLFLNKQYRIQQVAINSLPPKNQGKRNLINVKPKRCKHSKNFFSDFLAYSLLSINSATFDKLLMLLHFGRKP